jgi:alpha-beta hydrolase superfamily lysophospholipase
MLWRVTIVLLWLGLTGCTQAFFHPLREQELTPGPQGLAYEDVWVESADGVRIHGWFLPAKSRASGTVMFLHGNAKNISAYLKNVQWLTEYGFNVFMLEYRGYGNSHGEPTLPGVLADVNAGFTALLRRQDVDRQRIAIYGQSLGGALAVYYVAHTAYRPYVRALVVESAFSSYRAITTEKLASFWLTWPFQWMPQLTVDEEYSPLPVVEKIAPIPLLVIHGDQDPIVPVHQAGSCTRRHANRKNLIVPGGVHNDAMPRFRMLGGLFECALLRLDPVTAVLCTACNVRRAICPARNRFTNAPGNNGKRLSIVGPRSSYLSLTTSHESDPCT